MIKQAGKAQMAAARTPGPLGTSGLPQSLDDGTLIRALSPLPGPVGTWGASAQAVGTVGPAVPIPPRPVRRGSGATAMPLLRQGSRGPDVERLQRLVNLHSPTSPDLQLDGVFGPVTLRALQRFQTGANLAADGVAGKDTWFHLLRSDKTTAVQPPARPVPPAPKAAPVSARGPASPPPASPANLAPIAAPGIAEWPLGDKFAEVLRRTAPKLPGSMQQEFLALLSPASVGIIVGTLVVWAGSHAFGVGAVVDLALDRKSVV